MHVVRAVVLAGAVLATGCSSDTGSAETDATIAATDEPFCEAFGDLLVGPLAEGGFDSSDPEVLRTAVLQTQDVVDQLRASAPADVEREVGDLADTYDAMFDVLETYGYDLDRLGTDATPQELAALDAVGRAPSGPGVEDPYEVLVDFMGERCSAGVTIPPDLLPTDQP